MKFICGPNGFTPVAAQKGAERVILYGQPGNDREGSAGDAAKGDVLRRRLNPVARAWDLLSIALSVMAADCAVRRVDSPDGWTREFELEITVGDPDFWYTQTGALQRTLAFLTTDRWTLRFHGGGLIPDGPRAPIAPEEDSVVLLSGGLDSLVGSIDLAAAARKPFAISQTVRGDAKKQKTFAALIGGGLQHLQLNHNAFAPGEEDDTTQRARSLIFMTFGVVVGTALKAYREGAEIPLFVCENGFIALNPPLTGSRLGSLSTRTAHPDTLAGLQHVLREAGINVRITTPYALKTKGEMLKECADQKLLRALALQSTSCGRFQRHNYRQCGRCVPCQVRRAAFLAWGQPDTTDYVFRNLGQNDDNHSRFDDVRSVALALATVDSEGLDAWLAGALSSPNIQDRAGYRSMVARAVEELRALHVALGVA